MAAAILIPLLLPLLPKLLQHAEPVWGQLMLNAAERLKSYSIEERDNVAVREVVEGISRTHPDWSSTMKYEFVYRAVSEYFASHGKAQPEHVVNWLIELHRLTLPPT